MKYPKLVPEWVRTTPIYMTIETEGLTEDGEPSYIELGTDESPLYCNFQDGGKVRLTEEERYIDVMGRAYFDGDICPELSNITAGTAYIFGETREILKGYKRRDPDGNVNHTEIVLR